MGRKTRKAEQFANETDPPHTGKWYTKWLKLPTVRQFTTLTCLAGVVLLLLPLWFTPAIPVAMAGLGSWVMFMVVPLMLYMLFFKLIPSLFCSVEIPFIGKGPFLPKMGGWLFGDEKKWFLGSTELTTVADLFLKIVCNLFTIIGKIGDKLNALFSEILKNPLGTAALALIKIFRVMVSAIGDLVQGVSSICTIDPITPLTEFFDIVVAPLLDGMRKIFEKFVDMCGKDVKPLNDLMNQIKKPTKGIMKLCGISIGMNDIVINRGQLLDTTVGIDLPDSINATGINDISQDINIPPSKLTIPMSGIPDINFASMLGDMCDGGNMSNAQMNEKLDEMFPPIKIGNILGDDMNPDGTVSNSSNGLCKAVQDIAQSFPSGPELQNIDPKIDFSQILGGKNGPVCTGLANTAKAFDEFEGDIIRGECKVRKWMGGQVETLPPDRVKKRRDTPLARGDSVSANPMHPNMTPAAGEKEIWASAVITKVLANGHVEVKFFGLPTWLCDEPRRKPENVVWKVLTGIVDDIKV